MNNVTVPMNKNTCNSLFSISMISYDSVVLPLSKWHQYIRLSACKAMHCVWFLIPGNCLFFIRVNMRPLVLSAQVTFVSLGQSLTLGVFGDHPFKVNSIMIQTLHSEKHPVIFMPDDIFQFCSRTQYFGNAQWKAFNNPESAEIISMLDLYYYGTNNMRWIIIIVVFLFSQIEP